MQSLSGTVANLSVYLGLLKTRKIKILSMELSAGGHLSHGHKVNASSMFYKIIHYALSEETNELDYKKLKKLLSKKGPILLFVERLLIREK